jgi:hypothetical protein
MHVGDLLTQLALLVFPDECKPPHLDLILDRNWQPLQDMEGSLLDNLKMTGLIKQPPPSNEPPLANGTVVSSIVDSDGKKKYRFKPPQANEVVLHCFEGSDGKKLFVFEQRGSYTRLGHAPRSSAKHTS